MDDEKKPSRELAFVVHPDDVKTPADEDAFANEISDGIVKLVDEERKRQGLPPLTG